MYEKNEERGCRGEKEEEREKAARDTEKAVSAAGAVGASKSSSRSSSSSNFNSTRHEKKKPRREDGFFSVSLLMSLSKRIDRYCCSSVAVPLLPLCSSRYLSFGYSHSLNIQSHASAFSASTCKSTSIREQLMHTAFQLPLRRPCRVASPAHQSALPLPAFHSLCSSVAPRLSSASPALSCGLPGLCHSVRLLVTSL